MTYQLRPYQSELLSRIYQSWEAGHNRVLAQLTTGGGKTICFSMIVQQAVTDGQRCLVLAHREELINQAVEKLESITDEPVGLIKAGCPVNYDRMVQVASVQSMKSRIGKCGDFDLIIIDEAHHTTLLGSYGKILDCYPQARVLGVTATPVRLDGKGFRGTFTDLVCGATVTELIEIGALSPYKYYAGERSMSIDGVGKAKGDYKASDIESANPVDLVANQVIEAMRLHLQGKQAVVFAVSVAHSIAITDYLRLAGITSHHLDGMTDSAERRSAMDLFRNKQIQVLTNCSLFDEGLDIPSLDGVIIARPTASVSRYLQMVGRALRVAEGKEQAVIVDLAENYQRLGMPDDERVWTLDGIEKKQRFKSKGKTKQRNPQTGEVENIYIADTGTEFIEIPGGAIALTPELKRWIAVCDGIISAHQSRGTKPSWCAYRLIEAPQKPPLEAWKYLGKKLGYHHGWAKYKFEEWSSVATGSVGTI